MMIYDDLWSYIRIHAHFLSHPSRWKQNEANLLGTFTVVILRSSSTMALCWRTPPPSRSVAAATFPLWLVGVCVLFARFGYVRSLVVSFFFRVFEGGSSGDASLCGWFRSDDISASRQQVTTSPSTRTGHPRWAASRCKVPNSVAAVTLKLMDLPEIREGLSLQEIGVMVPRKSRTTRTWRSFTSPAELLRLVAWLGDKWMVCDGKCQKCLPPSPSPPSPSLSEDIGNVLFFWLRSVATSVRLSIGTCFVEFLSSFLLRPIALIIHCNHCNHHGYSDFKYHESWLFHFGFFTMTTTILDSNPTMPSWKWLQMAAGVVAHVAQTATKRFKMPDFAATGH